MKNRPQTTNHEPRTTIKNRLFSGNVFLKAGMAAILGILLFLFIFVPLSSRYYGKRSFTVRVRLVHDSNKVRISSEGVSSVYDAGNGRILAKEVVLDKASIAAPEGGNINLAGKLYETGSIIIEPSLENGLSINGITYRGDIQITETGKGLDVINKVELEGYLKGVLPKEAHSFWPFAALKAQAIASRSFAAAEALRHRKDDYDLTADTFSQVYGGSSAERWRTNKAVDATRGKVMEYEGKVLPGYFHSCCGGHTENILKVWGVSIKPLLGVKCPWCRWTPHFRWQVRIPTKSILERLNNAGYYVKKIDDIKEGPRDDSGRLEYVSVRSGNQWNEIPVGHFSSAIGRRDIKSSNFKVKKYPRFYLFSGYGWGHGVGMCQWGAFGLALRWKSEKGIIEQYYPGVKIVDLREVLKK